MTTLVSPFPLFRATDSVGNPLSGGKLYTYVAGTSTAQATYVDASGNTANTNPVILDAAGQANVWLLRSAYKFVLKDANDVTQWTVDNINVTPSKVVDVEDYGAVGNGSHDDSQAFIDAATAAGTWGTVMVKRPSVSYNLGSNVPNSVFWMMMGGAQVSGVGTLTGIQIAMKSAGELSIVSPTGTNTLSIDSANNWALNGASFDLAGGHTTVNGGGLIISENNYGAAINPGDQANGKLVFYSGYGLPALDYNVSDQYNLTWNDSYFANGFSFGSLGFPRMGDAGANSYGYFQTSNLVYDGENYNPTSDGDVFGQGVLNLHDTYITELGGSGSNLRRGIYIDTAISINDGVNSTNTVPSNEWVIGCGHSWAGLGTPLDGFFIQKNIGGAGLGIALAIDANGCVGLGLSPALGGAQSNQGTPGLFVKGHGSGSTNIPLVVWDVASGGTSYKTVSIRRGGSSLGTEVGSISTTSSATAYNTSSDYRLKENLKPIDDALAVVNATPMYRGNFKVAPEEKVAFGIAHEVQKLMPWAVQGVKDEVNEKGEPVMQSLDYSKLVPILWAAVQQLSKEVEQLKGLGQ